MAEILPLRGFRYNSAHIHDLGAVVSPPYDVISPGQQAMYYERSPVNCIRLEFGRDLPGDDALVNRYTRAATTFAQWRMDGTLRLEPQPVYYLYRQHFSIAGHTYQRSGLMARVRLEPWAAGVILPHEQTLAKPKSDRLRLLRACAANLSPIMATYDDDGAIRDLLATIADREPESDFVDAADERHQLWLIADPAVIAKLSAAFATKPLFIADGHHRYETALAYREEVRELHRELNPADAANAVLMTLIAMDDPGLVVLPTHRLVRGVDPALITALPDRLGAHWELTPLEARLAVKTLVERLAKAGEAGPAAIVATAKQRWLLQLSAAGTARMRSFTEPAAWQGLDAAIAQELILGTAFDIARDAIASGDQVSYVRDPAEALTALKEKSNQAAILLNPTRPEQVRDVALAGGRMPQKSTYFYPKLITGLVINPLW